MRCIIPYCLPSSATPYKGTLNIAKLQYKLCVASGLTYLDEKLVMQKSRRQPQSSVTVRRFRKRKSCWHVIAISQALIPAPTLTEMQGFQANKRMLRASPFPLLHTASILRVLPFHDFVTRARIEPVCNGWEAHAITTRLCQTQRCNIKMLYLNQMYEKKAIDRYA